MGIKKASMPISDALKEYDMLREQKKTIDSRMNYLSTLIKENAEENGVTSDNGSYFVDTPEFVYGKVARTSISLNDEKALEFVKKNRYMECVVMKETLDLKAFSERISTGDITSEDVEKLSVKSVSYAVDVKKKSELPEVQETILKEAKRK